MSEQKSHAGPAAEARQQERGGLSGAGTASLVTHLTHLRKQSRVDEMVNANGVEPSQERDANTRPE